MEKVSILKKLFCSSLIMVLFASCQKNIKDQYPEENLYEKFAGEYEMYDPDNDQTYLLILSYKGPSTIYIGDSIEILNYGNKFNINYAVNISPNDPFGLDGTIIKPAYDLQGNRWVLSTVGIVGDTVYNSI